jgi:DNA end-binding protein Ku
LPKSAKPSGKQAPEELLEGDEQPRSRPFWSGTISFGLVTIPVDLYSATRSTRVSLRMLAPSGTPVARRYFDEKGKPLESPDLERGYEMDKGEFVVVSDEELEALAPEQSRDIDLTRFVERDSIPPLFFERAYILAPSGNSNLAYRLLASTLERTKRAGIASFVMRGKQYVVAIVAEDGLLRAETLRFAQELRSPDSIGLPAATEPSAQKVKSLRAAIHKAHGGAPAASELADEYWQRLEKLVKKKHAAGEDLVNPEPVESEDESVADVIDLVAVLRKSLGETDNSNADTRPASSASATPKRAAKRSGTRTKSAVSKRRAPAKKSTARPSKKSSARSTKSKPAKAPAKASRKRTTKRAS